jgi:hypothetical protein
MKRVLALLAAVAFPVLAVATVVSFAQQSQQATQGGIVMKQRVIQDQDGAPPPPPPPGDILFMASEINFGGKVVKGAPYSAQAVTETVQTLGDGNRIVNKTTSALYRDNDGRTRRELTIKMLGSLGDSGEPLQTVFINDPIAGVSYSLDSKSRTAHKSIPFKLTQKFKTGGPLPSVEEGHRFDFRVEEGPVAGVVVKTPPPGVQAAPEAVDKLKTEYSFRIQTESAGGATYMFRRKGPNENEVKEQLGKQNIEGVEAEGTRSTITIPAGEIGNERPIEIVSERWYSLELQMDVMTRHSDPRSGETIYRLTNISRLEPAKSLFEVPTDYTISEGLKVTPTLGPFPARVRKPE